MSYSVRLVMRKKALHTGSTQTQLYLNIYELNKGGRDIYAVKLKQKNMAMMARSLVLCCYFIIFPHH